MAAKEQQIISFQWEGKDKHGNRSQGKIEAESPSAAKALLRNQGINPQKIRKESSFGLFNNANAAIKPLDIAFFTRQMATMMKAGVPLLQGLEIVSNGSEKKKFKEMIKSLRNDVNGGLDFSAALAKFPQYFDDLFCNLVAAGEKSGALEQMLDRLATYKEKVESLKAKIKKAKSIVGVLIVMLTN